KPWSAFNESRGREGYLMPDLDLVKTGIKGLDDILFGGIPRGTSSWSRERRGRGRRRSGSSSCIAAPASSTRYTIAQYMNVPPLAPSLSFEEQWFRLLYEALGRIWGHA